MIYILRGAQSALLACGSICTLASSLANAQSVVWENDWIVSRPALFDYSANAVFSPDGELIYATNQQGYDGQFSRATSAGGLRWSTDISAEGSSFFSILPYADGSAVVAADSADGNGGFSYIARIDAGGNVAWSRQLNGAQLIQDTPQLIVAWDCGVLNAIEPVSGQVIWRYSEQNAAYQCDLGGVAADGLGNLYTAFQSMSTGTGENFHLVKLDSAGRVIWDAAYTDTSGASLGGLVAGVAGNHVFLKTNADVRAYRLGDGSSAWAAPFNLIDQENQLLLAGSTPEPILVDGSGSVRRLAADTGVARWTQSLGNAAVELANVVDGAIIIDANVQGGSNTVFRIDSDTGSILWTSILPNLQYVAAGNSGSGALGFFGFTSPGLAPIENLDASTGQVLSSVALPSSNQGLGGDGTSISEDSGHMVSVAVAQSGFFAAPAVCRSRRPLPRPRSRPVSSR